MQEEADNLNTKHIQLITINTNDYCITIQADIDQLMQRDRQTDV